MGEYWKPVNFTRREFVHPHDVNCGLKLGEWNYPESAVMERIKALRESGQWQPGDDVAAISDYGGVLQMYGEPGERPDDDGNGSLYDALEDFENVSVPTRGAR